MLLHLTDWKEQEISRWLVGKLRLGAWCCLWEAGCTAVSASRSVPPSGTEAGFCVTRLGEKEMKKKRKWKEKELYSASQIKTVLKIWKLHGAQVKASNVCWFEPPCHTGTPFLALWAPAVPISHVDLGYYHSTISLPFLPIPICSEPCNKWNK